VSRGNRSEALWASALYVLVFVPAGALVRLVRDPLRLRRPSASNWRPLPPADPSLDAAKRLG
jgi:hypothetical protein